MRKGAEKEAKAKIFLTESIQSCPEPPEFPLYFSAGYELPDGAESAYVKRGWVVVSPRELADQPAHSQRESGCRPCFISPVHSPSWTIPA